MNARARSPLVAAGCIAAALAACAGPRGSGPEAAIAVEGARSHSVPELRKVLRETLGDEVQAFSRAWLEDAAWELTRYYRSSGFAFCEVEADPGPSSIGLDATLRVLEGPRVALEDLSFTGHRAFSTKELRPLVLGPPPGPFRAKEPWYVAAKLDAGVHALEQLYRSRGYALVRVLEPRVRFSEDRSRAWAEIEIDEGVRFFLENAAFSGGPAEILPVLQKIADDHRGRPLSPGLVRTLVGRAEEALSQRGYADARVTVTTEQRGASGAVDLELAVDSGPRVTLSEVRISGLRRTREGLVRDCLPLESGDVYDAVKEREGVRELYRLGIFSAVRVHLEGQGNERTLAVDVEEAPGREVYVEPGWGSYERLRFLAGWQERNFRGTGRALALDTTLAELAQRGEISITDPRFLGSNTEARASLFASRRIEPSFTSEEIGAALALSRTLSERVRVGVGYELERSAAVDVSASGPGVNQTVDISAVNASATYDSRDDLFVPGEGLLAKARVAYGAEPLGSELDFLRFEWTAAVFRTVQRATVLALSFRGGAIAPLDDTSSIPIQERFFNGGENTVRSFREDELGPADVNGDPLGGEAFSVLSIELRREIRGNFEGALFFDAGNVVPEYTDYLDFDDVRSGIGVGVRYLLPVGLIRIDFAVNPSPRTGEEDSVVHFSFGMAF